ncbi:HmuY family protein [Chitinophaga sp. NPDC101104]|uniref:HmuY family protein n=1 Tax=Chitinophaga sp. NPDC101104 TaxID=3390561 RepID=UPI003CFD839A
MRHSYKWAAGACAAAVILAACSKDDKDATPVPAGNYNKLISVANFNGDTTTSKTTIYFSLEKEKAGSPKNLQSGDWDVAFGGNANSAVSGNYGANEDGNTSAGKGGPGKGGVLIIDKPFDQVTRVPDGAVFITASTGVGLDTAGFFGTTTGWCVYDFSGTLRATKGIGGNSAATQKHTVWARPDRTIIVRTASGNYAKLKITSMYKDAPAEPETATARPFFHFQYVLAAPGSKDFTIR